MTVVMSPSCGLCGHPEDQHGQEQSLCNVPGSKREVCLFCPGHEEPGYPRGEAWHRFKAMKQNTTKSCSAGTSGPYARAAAIV